MKPAVWGSAVAVVGLVILLRAFTAAAERARIARERQEAEQAARERLFSAALR